MTRGVVQLTLVVVIVAGLTAVPVAGVGIDGAAKQGNVEANSIGANGVGANGVGANGIESASTIETASNDALQTCNYTDVYQDAIAGVVLIQTGGGLGSGFVWSTDENGTSYVVTNQHVVGDNTTVAVQFSQGETVRGSVVGVDAQVDLAVVRVEETPGYVVALPTAERPARPGEPVAALGSPFGLERTITQGIVSGVNRTMPTQQGLPIPLSVQTDAAINPGNSGGPLVACNGSVLGVNRAGGGEDIGFAISAPVLQEVVPVLIDQGEYEHSFLGVQTAPVNPLVAVVNDLNATAGVYVVDVLEGGPADGALQGASEVRTVQGARVPVGGDVIVAVENRTIETRDDLLAYLLTETRPGETVAVTVLRDGERRTVNVTLGERPRQAGA
jgi:S1-C subfamily serine protease